MKKIIVWKFVDKDGLPEPDLGEKDYFVVHSMGAGYATYEYEMEDIKDNSKYGWHTIRKENGRWYADFDTVGHENTIFAYFEILWYDEE